MIFRPQVAGLALTNILTTQSPPVLQRLKTIIKTILEVLNDVTRADEDGVMTDNLLLVVGQPAYYDNYSVPYETDHDRRTNQLVMTNPVHTIALKDYLQSQVSICQRFLMICIVVVGILAFYA